MSNSVDINEKMNPKQIECLKILANSSPYTGAGYGGPKGGGKSKLIRSWLHYRAMKYPQSNHLLVRRTFQDLYRNHITKFLEEYRYLKYNDQKKHLIFPNGSRIELGYYETERDLEHYQGVEWQSAAIDQAEQLPKALITRIRSCMRSVIRGLNTKTLITFNWGGIGHNWLVRMFVSRLSDINEDLSKWGYVQASVYDNKYINPEYINELKSLPPQLRKAYLDGDHTAFEGQFFTITGLSREDPFDIKESVACNHLYGSLDHGITHNTSFGLWYLDDANNMHRLFSYLNNGGTAQSHAQEIRSRIESFKYTHGHMPVTIWADPSMWTKERLNESMTRAVIDEYEDVFKGTRTVFTKANNDKLNGCGLMRQAFAPFDGLPHFFYWPEHNHGFVESLQSMVADENHPEQYLKVDGDDTVDECRYGIIGLSTMRARNVVNAVNQTKAVKYRSSRESMDWKLAV